MTVITISREYGSGGDQISHEVAEALGYHLVDRRFLGDIIGQFGYVEFDREYGTLPTFWERFDTQREKERDMVVDLLNQVLRAVAQHGNVVILGRSGFVVLAGLDDVLHVRLQAPFEVRVRRILTEQHLSFEEAETLVRQNDRLRLAFVEEFYHVPWNSMQSFDLIVNTAKVDPELVRDMIVDAVRFHEISAQAPVTSVRSFDVDRLLANSVSEALHCEQVHGMAA